MNGASLTEVLQITGWLLTVAGQIQVALKRRSGFVSWIAANAVLIAVCVQADLWWTAGMYLTNVGVCAWSFRRWTSAAGSARRLPEAGVRLHPK
jgi:hypothetical protein